MSPAVFRRIVPDIVIVLDLMYIFQLRHYDIRKKILRELAPAEMTADLVNYLLVLENVKIT